jgi:hypothetical protein
MSYMLVAFWVSSSVGRPRFTLSVSARVPASWRGLKRCSVVDLRDYLHGRMVTLALGLS